MQTVELILFAVAVIGVIALGIWKSSGDADDNGKADASESTANYFLAGRGLTWWLVGFSLIAANISTEQFVGMSGSAANWLGMAIASYEWMAAATLIGVAFIFLPRFLRTGIYTIPEFLELRFGIFSRTVLAVLTILVLVMVPTASVIFSGAKFVSTYYDGVSVLGNLTAMCWLIAALAAVYVFIGGLKACAWTDLIWGSALILGGALVMYFAFSALTTTPAEELIKTKVANSTATVQDIENAGAWERLTLLNDGKDGEAVAVTGPNGSGGKMHMVRPNDDPDIPWSALLLGLWIPNFFYWGLNQYIVQRTLGSKSLAEGQKGIVFAAFLKLIIPFVVVIPGILAFNLFSGKLHESAASKNIKAVEGVAQNEYFELDPKFVELQPELAAQALAHNAQLAGTTVGITADSSTFTEDYNATNEVLIANEKLSKGPLLVGYDYDSAFPVLVRELISKHWYISWFVLAALFGAVVSSLASMLNSASTVATMDLYKRFTGENDSEKLVKIGRGLVVFFVLIAAFIAPNLDNPRLGGIFNIIQDFQGFISPGVLAVFLFGFLSPRTPRIFGAAGILLNFVLYGALKLFAGDIAFLNRMSICFIAVVVLGIVLTIVKPLAEPIVLPENSDIPLQSSKGAKMAGFVVLGLTAVLYLMFW